MANIDFGVSSFMNSFRKGGALASLFSCSLTTPNAVGSGTSIDEFRFKCKTASFPASEITANEVAYMGRTINIPGNRESQQWTTEVYNDEDHELRAFLLDWLNMLNGHENNKRSTEFSTLSQYTGTLSVMQHAKTAEETTNTVKFHNAWPSSGGEITLDWETNEIQTYEITWEFSNWSQSLWGIGE